ncbi:MAG: D-alanyl-D-alanine carboxypeptidase/D-alanyl-D-alanine-endopeptidase [Ignavibacteriae bacterium]|nr:MAG: D-alanyl-D-alanine carboxypeptidase/D-alanyl-D-alanine-endopeptidase [Ignavibacteriota bacterium]
MKYTLLILYISVSLFAQSSLRNRIDEIVNTIPSSTKSSIFIYNAITQKSVYEKKISEPMIPASNTKLFTTAAALKLMKSDYKVSTKIFTDAIDIKSGIIDGNLFIKGFGQSTFELSDLDSLIKNLINLGIKNIEGNIVGDDSYFDDIYTRDDWIVNERANVRLPPVSATIINKNQFVVTLYSRGKVGDKLRYSIYPKCNFIKVNMQAKVTTYRSYPRFSTSFNKNGIAVKIKGGLRKRRSSRKYVVNITNPPLYFALLLKEKLLQNGIKVRGKAITGSTPSLVTELTTSDIKLSELIKLINKESNNYLAECLFKNVGAYYSNESGNSFYATQAILSAFEDGNILDNETVVVDGSGISRFNTVTTGSIVRLLNYIYKDEKLFKDFYHSLAISGVDGTLENRRINNFVLGNFHGKTGTLNGVSSLSGYLTGKNNNIFIVSIIQEYKRKGSYFHKNIEDKILLELSK